MFELGHSTAVRGLTIYYPEQKPADIHPYSWTFHLQGHDNTVENVTLINSCNGIRLGPEGNVRHRIRSVYGCVLRRGIFVDACTDIRRIDNVQFVCMPGDIRTELVVENTCRGSVRLVNCAFWGPARQNVVSHSRSFVSLSDCYLSSSGRQKNPGLALVEADGGRLQVRGCSFGTDEPSITLLKGLQHAIITENNGVRGVEILSEIGEKAVIANNEPCQP